MDESLAEHSMGGVATSKQHNGKEMSYNNYLDADAAYSCCCDFKVRASFRYLFGGAACWGKAVYARCCLFCSWVAGWVGLWRWRPAAAFSAFFCCRPCRPAAIAHCRFMLCTPSPHHPTGAHMRDRQAHQPLRRG